MVDRVAGEIFRLCSLCGFDILRYPGNLRAYLKKTLQNCGDAVDQCVQVLETPGFVDGLMWCRYYAAEPERLAACQADLRQSVLKQAGQDAGRCSIVCSALFAACTADVQHRTDDRL